MCKLWCEWDMRESAREEKRVDPISSRPLDSEPVPSRLFQPDFAGIPTLLKCGSFHAFAHCLYIYIFFFFWGGGG